MWGQADWLHSFGARQHRIQAGIHLPRRLQAHRRHPRIPVHRPHRPHGFLLEQQQAHRWHLQVCRQLQEADQPRSRRQQVDRDDPLDHRQLEEVGLLRCLREQTFWPHSCELRKLQVSVPLDRERQHAEWPHPPILGRLDQLHLCGFLQQQAGGADSSRAWLCESDRQCFQWQQRPVRPPSASLQELIDCIHRAIVISSAVG